jgi:hypothetical protein
MTRVVVVINGGVVQEVHSNSGEVEVHVIDLDCEDCEAEEDDLCPFIDDYGSGEPMVELPMTLQEEMEQFPHVRQFVEQILAAG